MATTTQTADRTHGTPAPATLTIHQADCCLGKARGRIYDFDPIPDAYADGEPGPRLAVTGSWSMRQVGVRVPAGATWHWLGDDLFVRVPGVGPNGEDIAVNAAGIVEGLKADRTGPSWEGFEEIRG